MTLQSDKKSWAILVACGSIGIPACLIVFANVHLDPVIGVLIFGLGIVGAAFLISWADESHEMGKALMAT